MQENFKNYFYIIYLIGDVLKFSIKIFIWHQLINILYTYTEIGPTEISYIHTCMRDLNEHLKQLYNYYANLIDASFVVININSNLPSSFVSTSVSIDENDGVDVFAIWSTLFFLHNTIAWIVMNFNFTCKSRQSLAQRIFCCGHDRSITQSHFPFFSLWLETS